MTESQNNVKNYRYFRGGQWKDAEDGKPHQAGLVSGQFFEITIVVLIRHHITPNAELLPSGRG